MEEYIQKLLKQLEKEMDEIDPSDSPVNGHDQRLNLVKKSIDTLKSYLKKYPLRTISQYVHYFKQLAPLFYWQYSYYTKLYNFELTKISSSEESLALYIESELKAIANFFENNVDFWRYNYMNATYLDAQLFTPGIPENWILDDVAIIMDEEFCLPSHRLSCIKAYEAYRSFLKDEINKLKNPPPIRDNEWEGRKYTWEGQDTDLVELIYGLAGRDAIKVNGQKMAIKDYKIMCHDFFGIDLGNVYDTHNYNQKRKIDPVSFLNSMIKVIRKEK